MKKKRQMLQFNIDSFISKNRTSIKEVSGKSQISEKTLFNIRNRNTIKPSMLGKLEAVYGDLSGYVIN
jgi:lambda repressor-like predicted transcriptional regulator